MKRPLRSLLFLIAAIVAFIATSPVDAASAAPRVLIIGDSISQGYTPHVTNLLAGKAEVTRIPENGESSDHGVEQLDAWLGSTRWDVISFNFGLWDICYRNPSLPEGHDMDKLHGTIAVSPDDYRKNLERIVERLQRTGAHLVWENTTVVPDGDPGRKPEDAVQYNRIAREVMEAHGVSIVDLHQFTAGFAPELFKRPHNVHYADAGYQKIAAVVAQAIQGALPVSGGAGSGTH